MKCLKCGEKFSPFNTFKITRWTFIKCKKCGSKYGRKVDIQFFLVALIGTAGLFVTLKYLVRIIGIVRLSLLIPVLVAVFLIWWLAMVLFDALTIRLVPKDTQEIEKQTK